MAAGDGGAGRKRAVPPARAAGSRRARDAAGVGPEAARGVGGQQRPGVAAHGHLVVPSRGGHWEPCRGFDPRTVCPPLPPRRAGVAVLGFGEESPVRDKKTCPCASTAPPG